MAHTPEPGPRERILDAAEHAFGEFGFEGASLRHIVQAAEVNLATVYYYFNSKEGLMEAVLKRRFGPLREQQLQLLREAEAQAGGRPLRVEQILNAFLRPPLQVAVGCPAQQEAVARLIGRIATEPNPQTQEMLRSGHAEVRQAILQALQATLPHVPAVVLRWRLEFAIGAMAFILCNPHKLEIETHGACNPVEADTVLAEMIAFFSGGFGGAAPACPAANHFKSEISNLKSHKARPKSHVPRPTRRPARAQ
jgi:AcrR family transcriptional regulator